MFYIDDAVIGYPSKRIVEDILSRSATDFVNATTGKMGCRELLQEQLRSDAGRYSLEEILTGYDDFNPHKARPDDDYGDGSRASDRADYNVRLEDIEEHWLHDYAKSIVIGFKLNNTGMRSADWNSRVATYMVDRDNADEVILETDLYEKDDYDYTLYAEIDARRNLPKCLRILQEGSELHGGHLLSFIIAKAKLKKDNPLFDAYLIKPAEIVAQGVYAIRSNTGEIAGRFTIESNTYSANNGYGLRRCMKWIRGEIKDKYYSTALELEYIAEILGIDLADEEHPERYTKELVENSVCLYLLGKQEFLTSENISVDLNLSALLQNGEMWKVQKVTEDVTFQESSEDARIEATVMIVLACKPELCECKNDALSKTLKLLTGGKNTINLSEFGDRDGFVTRRGKYYKVRVDSFEDNGGAVIGLITVGGHLVLVADSANVMSVDFFEREDIWNSGRSCQRSTVGISD